MPRNFRLRRNTRYDGTGRRDITESYGVGPYYNIQVEYGPGEWDNCVFLGQEGLKTVHREIGAILAKQASDARG